MKNLKLLFLPIFAIILLNSSCREEFSEEDALNLLNKVDLSIYVYNRSLNYSQPIEGARVVLVQGENSREIFTDANGIAFFPDAQFGGLFYSVEADNYTAHYQESVISSTNGNVNQETLSVGLYSMDDNSLATIKGKLLIETDLTNDTVEYASGITLNLRVTLDEGEQEFRTVSDENGEFIFRVPAEKAGSYTILRVPDIELKQRIAFLKKSTEDLYFPEALPRVEEVPTVFSLSTSFLRNHNNYPVLEVPCIFGIAESAAQEWNTAIINDVYMNSNGDIIGMDIYSGGYYPDQQQVRVDFYSLNGGSGAYAIFDMTNNSSLYGAYFDGNYTLYQGSGYPDQNYLMNRISYRAPSPQVGDSREKYLGYIMPGSNTIINIDYGTGVYRPYDYDFEWIREEDV